MKSIVCFFYSLQCVRYSYIGSQYIWYFYSVNKIVVYQEDDINQTNVIVFFKISFQNRFSILNYLSHNIDNISSVVELNTVYILFPPFSGISYLDNSRDTEVYVFSQ